MPENVVEILRDALAVVFLFVLRIGVPLMITFLIGAWLQQILREPEGEFESSHQEVQAGPRCWELKSCPEAKRAQCAAARRPDLPCWLALQVAGSGLTSDCYGCPLFKHAPAPVQISAARPVAQN